MEICSGRPATVSGSDEAAVYAALDSLGISYRTARHDAAFTMEACQAVEQGLGVPVCKNLFLCNKQQTAFYLLMLPGDKVFKTKYLSAQLGCARLSFAPDEAMLRLLHIRPGAVSPFGLLHDTAGAVRLIVDNDLLGTERIGCHPCVNTATVSLRLADLLGRVLPAAAHNHTVVELPRAAAQSER